MRRLAVIALLVTLGACSHGGTKAKESAPSTVAELTTTTEPKFTGAGSAAFCARARGAQADLAKLFTGAPSPDQAKAQFTAAAQVVKDLAAVAPVEIRTEARAMATVYDALLSVLPTVNWDLSRLPPDIVALLNSNQIRTAGDRLEAYQRQVCGITD